MSGWIKFEKNLEDDPRVKTMARHLRNADVTQGRYASATHAFPVSDYIAKILGGLAKIWFYADKHIRDDNTIPLGIDDINDVIGIEGFAQLLPKQWFVVLDAETVELPDFIAHNGPDAKKNALGAKRQAKHRERVALESDDGEHRSNASSVTDALPDKTRQDHTRQDKTKSRTAAKRAPTDSKTVSRETIPDWFLTFKLAYPERGGDPNWRGALRAANGRIADGHHPAEFIGAAERYAEFCRITGKTGTEYVKQAATFLGPGKPFLESWNAPATKADVRLQSNLSEADKFMLRTEDAA